jgi:ribosomal protein L29
MSENIKDASYQILVRIQDELTALRKEVRDGSAKSEESHRRIRRDIAGMLVMAKSTAGDFDLRIRSVEDRITALETRRS